MAWNHLPRLTTLKITQTWYSINPTWKLCFQILKHDENYSFQDDLQSQDPQLNPEVSNANTAERRTLPGRFWTGQRRSWERNCWQRNVTRSLTLMGFGLKTWMTRWMVRCHCFFNSLKTQATWSLPLEQPCLCCDQWARHMIDNLAFRLGFLFVNNLRIRWCFILRGNDCKHRLPRQMETWLLWGQGAPQDDPGQVLIPF